ncbi:MAG: helix-turn-helix protein [Bacteroidota bacterium]|nr:helix-turn-helix protein [Bacteroidota bacterium]
MFTKEETRFLQNMGAHIKRHRNGKGLSQKGLSDLLGWDRATVSRIESGHLNVSLSNVLKAARVLDIPISDVFLEP